MTEKEKRYKNAREAALDQLPKAVAEKKANEFEAVIEEFWNQLKSFSFYGGDCDWALLQFDRLRAAHKAELESVKLNAEYHQSMREMG